MVLSTFEEKSVAIGEVIALGANTLSANRDGRRSPELKPVMSSVWTTTFWWARADSNHMSGSASSDSKPCGNWRSEVSARRARRQIPG